LRCRLTLIASLALVEPQARHDDLPGPDDLTGPIQSQADTDDLLDPDDRQAGTESLPAPVESQGDPDDLLAQLSCSCTIILTTYLAQLSPG
jgi:hypothetical protein